MRLVDPEGTQLSLHESPEPGSVLLVKLLQRFDLLLQRFTLGGQARDGVSVSLLGSMPEFIGILLRIFRNLFCPCSRVEQNLVGVSPNIVSVRLGISGYLRRRCVCIRQRLVRASLKIVGMRLGIPDYLLGLCARIGANLVRLMMSTGDVILSCSPGQSQNLESLTLGVGIGRGICPLRRLAGRRRPYGQPFYTALHPIVTHRMTSIVGVYTPRLAPTTPRLDPIGRIGMACQLGIYISYVSRSR